MSELIQSVKTMTYMIDIDVVRERWSQVSKLVEELGDKFQASDFLWLHET